MIIKINSLEITNFKCFRHKEFTFDSDVTTIRGRNGAGKTTIADAILFCLFGKNTAGQSDLELFKTMEDGKVIPNLDHSVEMGLHVYPNDGSDVHCVTLKRTIKEVWVKKRGSDESVFKNNTCEYFVNGDSYTKADFEKYVGSLITEDTFKAITNPVYFPSLKWQTQRHFLAQMVGSIEPEAIADTDELAALVRQLDASNDDIVSYRKHLSYQIKQIKDKLDKIPVRLEEQHKALPEKLDWDALQVKYTDVSRQSEEVNAKIIAIKSGNGGDVLREEIRKEINAIRTDMEKIEVEQRQLLRIRQDEHDRAINTARQQFNTLVTTQRDLETSLPSFDTLISRCKETLAKCEQDAEKIRLSWAENNARKLDWSDDDNICPTCGQYLPAELIAERRQKAISDLNTKKALRKQALIEEADRVKAIREGANQEIEQNELRKAEKEKALADIKEQINTAFSEKQKLEKMQLPTIDSILSENAQYVALSKQLSEAQAKLESVSIDEDNTKKLADLEAQKSEYTAIVSQLTTQLATKAQYDKILSLIADIEQEQKDLISQLSDLERKEDIARQYQDRQNTILEKRVNQHFSLVKWKMFRTVNNGGDPFDEPYCECYVDGVAYHGGLNQAARLNAGLDICNALCNHYNISAPILIDNAESTINILQTVGQQVRFQVSDTDLQTL